MNAQTQQRIAEINAMEGISIAEKLELEWQAMDQELNEKIKIHAKGEIHPDDVLCEIEYNSLMGREPGKFGFPTCLNTSSRAPTGGAIGESQLPWKYLREKDPIIWRNGVGLPLSMIPRELAPADVIAQIDALEA